MTFCSCSSYFSLSVLNFFCEIEIAIQTIYGFWQSDIEIFLFKFFVCVFTTLFAANDLFGSINYVMQAILADPISDTAYTADAIVLAVMADAIIRGFSLIGGFCPRGFLSGGVLVQAGSYPGGFCPGGFCPGGFCPQPP